MTTFEELEKSGCVISRKRGGRSITKHALVMWGPKMGLWHWVHGMGPKIKKLSPSFVPVIKVTTGGLHRAVERKPCAYKAQARYIDDYLRWFLGEHLRDDHSRTLGLLAGQFERARSFIPEWAHKKAWEILKQRYDKGYYKADAVRSYWRILMMLNFCGEEFVEKYQTDPIRYDRIIEWAWGNGRFHMLKHLNQRKESVALKKIFHKAPREVIKLLMHDRSFMLWVLGDRYMLNDLLLGYKDFPKKPCFKEFAKTRFSKDSVKNIAWWHAYANMKLLEDEAGLTPNLNLYYQDYGRRTGTGYAGDTFKLLHQLDSERYWERARSLRSAKSVERLHDVLMRRFKAEQTEKLFTPDLEKEAVKLATELGLPVPQRDRLPRGPYPDNEFFKQITSMQGVIEEAKQMDHCVNIYFGEMYTFKMYVYHYSSQYGEGTIGIDPDGSIVEFNGKHNLPMPSQAWEHATDWMRQ